MGRASGAGGIIGADDPKGHHSRVGGRTLGIRVCVDSRYLISLGLGCLPTLARRLEPIVSKMSGDSARFNKIKSRRVVHRARMRLLRAELAAGKNPLSAAVEKPKA